jgi:hypothetical protein
MRLRWTSPTSAVARAGAGARARRALAARPPTAPRPTLP